MDYVSHDVVCCNVVAKKGKVPVDVKSDVEWSQRMLKALMRDVNLYGIGHWMQVKRSSYVFSNVSSNDIKDKWRQLTKFKLVQREESGDWKI